MEHNYAKVGGILSIVAGAFGILSLLAGIGFIVFLFAGYNTWDYRGYDSYGWNGYGFIFIFIIAMCLIHAILGALAITGGVFGIRKKAWGLALAGSIAGVLTFFPCGVVAVIFTALGKPEFETPPLSRTV